MQSSKSLVIDLPVKYPVFDFSKAMPVPNPEDYDYGVGKYLESRPHLYTESQYENRVIHMGVDIQAPVASEVKSFADGKVFGFTYNSLPQDYGYTLMTEHIWDKKTVWCLWGHLSKSSIDGKLIGEPINKGQVIAFVGDRHENGGWKPHLHVQISLQRPDKIDLPGVVSVDDLAEAKKIYPDPRNYIGAIY